MKSLKMNLRWLLTACAMAAVCAMICLAPTARAAGGEVSGCAYVDANENLVHDESEQLITGVPVRLERRDGGAWTEAARTETDLYGKYAFTGLSAGEYRVICTLSGQELYAVSVGTSMASEAGTVVGDAVTLEEGKSVSGGDVGLAPSARLALTVFQDSNGDGKRGDYDRGVPGIEVTLLEGETPLASAVTDEEGKAALYARAGRYTVRVTLPAGYGISDGSVQSRTVDLDVSFATGEEEALTLAVAPVGALGGRVFEDMDNDGIMGDGDLPIDEMMRALRSINYEGYVTLEWVRYWSRNMYDAGVVFPQFLHYMEAYLDKPVADHKLYTAHTGLGHYVWPHNQLLDLTFPQVLDRMVEEFPDQVCFDYTELDYKRTYSQFRDDVDEFARALIGMGVKRGDHVAIWATNVPAWYITFWATTKIGAVLVTVNTAYKIHEAEYLLRQSDTHTLVMIDGFKDSDYIGIVRELCPELAGQSACPSCATSSPARASRRAASPGRRR